MSDDNYEVKVIDYVAAQTIYQIWSKQIDGVSASAMFAEDGNFRYLMTSPSTYDIEEAREIMACLNKVIKEVERRNHAQATD